MKLQHRGSFPQALTSVLPMRQRSSYGTLRTHCAYRVDLADGALAVAPSRRPPKAVVHFLGGAFAGAAPYLTYSLLIDRLADRGGYTVITTPYAVTFRHDRCARGVHAAFLRALAELRADRSHKWAAPPEVHLHGVGHSNGALLQLLVGSLCSPPYASSALVSFNCRQVSDAVPLPLAPAQAAVQGWSSANGKTLEDAAGQAAQRAVASLLSAAQAAGLGNTGTLRSLRQLQPALAQVGSVFDEVGDGQLDFTPTPEQTRQLVAAQYAVPCTLLVRFSDDAIDQTPEMAALLRQRGGGGGVTELALPGNHVTPLAATPQWKVGGAFTPADAVAQAVLALAQADVRRLTDRLIEWLDASILLQK